MEGGRREGEGGGGRKGVRAAGVERRGWGVGGRG